MRWPHDRLPISRGRSTPPWRILLFLLIWLLLFVLLVLFIFLLLFFGYLHFTFPSGKLPSLSNRCASDVVSLRRMPRSRLSFGACAFERGSSIPRSKAGAPP